jgi:cytoskeletal protein CcmA (bactofilin family)
MADKDTDKSEKATIIGPETRISGELRGDEDVIVRGRVDGRVILTSTFTVEEGAIVQADVEAKIVLVSGVIVGNVNASEIVRLGEKARVVGDLTAPRVVIEAGAAYRGRLDMGDIEAGAASSARVSSRRSSSSEASSAKAAPPRLAMPARVAASPGAVVQRPVAGVPPRAPGAAAPARGPAPPSLPRPQAAAAGGIASGAAAAAWAKKKLQRRR